MRTKTTRRAAAAILGVILAVFILAGCQQQAGTVYESDTLRIERDGAAVCIYDLVGDAAYTFTAHRTRTQAADVREVKTCTDTDTIRLQTAGGTIIVTDKTAGKTLYVKGGRK